MIILVQYINNCELKNLLFVQQIASRQDSIFTKIFGWYLHNFRGSINYCILVERACEKCGKSYLILKVKFEFLVAYKFYKNQDVNCFTLNYYHLLSLEMRIS